MPDANIVIRRYSDLQPSAALDAGLDAVFFEASNTKSFAGDSERAAFRERWLGRYLTHDAPFAYVAFDQAGAVAGYLAGSISDPAATERFSDIAYFQTFRDLTRVYPAHLHVNLGPAYRGRGLGARLIDQFVADAKLAGAPGAHVVTSRGARNVGFYAENGFLERGASGEGVREIVFLGRRL
ncbi:MAG: GNAT family N-acetyltransferase [Hyphomicrobium sp.]